MQSAVSIPVLDIITQEIADLREVARDLGNIGRDMEATTALKFVDLTQAVERLTSTVEKRDARILEYRELIAALDQRLDEYQATSASMKETTDRLDHGSKHHEVLIQGMQGGVAHCNARLDHMERHLRGRGWHGSR
jgi:chromosome segregation ATPase